MAPVRQATGQEEFLAIVCADEDLLRAEFDAIVAASWDGPVPTPPLRPVPPPGRPVRSARATAYPEPLMPARPQQHGPGRWVRQRSPPRCSPRGTSVRSTRSERQVMS
jgi:hypothetical protein